MYFRKTFFIAYMRFVIFDLFLNLTLKLNIQVISEPQSSTKVKASDSQTQHLRHICDPRLRSLPVFSDCSTI